jgi:hypothetical protein
MAHKLFTAYKFGKPTTKSWSGIFGYKPQIPAATDALGEMFAVLALASEMEFEFEHIGGLLFDELQNGYFGDEDSNASIKQFEAAFAGVRRKIESLLTQERELANAGIDIQLAVVVLREDTLYAGVVGEAHIFIQRDGETNEVSSVLADPDLDGFMRIGSLRLQEGDRVMLATDNVDSHNSQEMIAGQMQELVVHHLDVARGATLLIGNGVEPELVEEEPVTEPIMETVETADETELTEVAEEEDDVPQTNTRPTFVKLPFLSRKTPAAPILDAEETEFHAENAPVNQDYGWEDADQQVVPSELNDYAQYEDNDDEEYGEDQPSLINKILAKIKTVAATAGAKLAPLAGSLGQRAKAALTKENLQNLSQQAGNMARGMQRGLSARGIGNGRGVANAGYDRTNYRNLRPVDPKRQRYMIGLAVLLGLVIIVGIRQTIVENDRRAKLDALQSQANRLSAQLETLQANATSAAASSQPDPKQQVLAQVSEYQAELDQIRQSELLTTALTVQLDQISDSLAKAHNTTLKIKPFTDAQVVTNLAANFPGSQPTDIEFTENAVYVTDSARNVVYRMATSIGSQAVAVLTDLQQPYLLTVDTQKNLVVVDRNAQSAVGVMNISNNSFRRIAGLGAERQGELTGIDIWANNRAIYAVNAARQSIVRQTPVGSNYQQPNYNSPWRKAADLAAAKDIHVDGSILTIISGQGLTRFLNNRPDQLVIRGLMPEDEAAMRNIVAFDLTAKNLYVADAANKRVLVFARDTSDSKAFDFINQYTYRGNDEVLSDVKDLVANGNDSQVFVLTGSQVIRIDL